LIKNSNLKQSLKRTLIVTKMISIQQIKKLLQHIYLLLLLPNRMRRIIMSSIMPTKNLKLFKKTLKTMNNHRFLKRVAKIHFPKQKNFILKVSSS
jgi:hypothetical protein